MAALYDGDGNRLFTMDYTGDCEKPGHKDHCGHDDCVFHGNGWGDNADIWIPDCSDTEVNGNAEDAMKELASLVSKRAQKNYSITEYVNDNRENEEVLMELDVRGSVTSAYTYGYERVSATTYIGRDSDTQYYLYDGLGSVTRIASEYGRIKETYAYDPYGNLTYGLPDSINYYGYNGESTNLFTGLQYLRARYYQMENGSFISEDTYAGQASQPLTLNRYTYVSNNPVNFIDPSGHKLMDGLKKLGNTIVDAVKETWDSAVDTVKDIGTKAVEGGKKVLNTVSNAFGTALENYNKSQSLIAESNRIEAEAVQQLIAQGGKSLSNVAEKCWDSYSTGIEMRESTKRIESGMVNYLADGLCNGFESEEEEQQVWTALKIACQVGANLLLVLIFLGEVLGGLPPGTSSTMGTGIMNSGNAGTSLMFTVPSIYPGYELSPQYENNLSSKEVIRGRLNQGAESINELVKYIQKMGNYLKNILQKRRQENWAGILNREI